MTAEERREAAIQAAMTEFARTGFRGTSTEAIARRVGVSQPYLFRLFPNKRALFIAAVERCMDDMWQVFDAASKGCEGEEALDRMADAYFDLVARDRDKLLLQLQMNVSTAAAEEAGDDEGAQAARTAWRRLWDRIGERTGVSQARLGKFFACGMLVNTLTALGFPPDDPMWAGLDWGPEPEESQDSPPGH